MPTIHANIEVIFSLRFSKLAFCLYCMIVGVGFTTQIWISRTLDDSHTYLDQRVLSNSHTNVLKFSMT